jgi:3'-phosphoadenosine 5'-phosphosulfate sulfotransferase (PAPS reductase)/FAD synthetase
MSTPPHALPDPARYDRILVAFPGGKDSCAVLVELLERGVEPRRIELHHHEVDGEGPVFMDWACTPDYCRTLAASFGLPLYRSWREGGFWREMHRQDAPTAAVCFEDPQGAVRRVGGSSGQLGTRMRFPQVTSDLRRRWCSAALKIDVMDAVLRNQDRFYAGRTLVCTGERAEESPARRHYPAFAPHRTDTRDSSRRGRHVDHWRPVHGWDEARVWAALQRHGIAPHVAYQLGWGRLSCMTCIFAGRLWATLRAAFPARFEAIAAREAALGVTIVPGRSIRALADAAEPLSAALADPVLIAQAEASVWRLPVRCDPAAWRHPAGAFRGAGGPT